jgi:acetoin utilization protein AcuB
MKISDIMRPEPMTVCGTDTLGTAQHAMRRIGVRHLPVLEDGKLVGMLSERDVLAARARAGDDEEDWWAITVHDAMHAPAQTAGPDDSLTEVAGRMAIAKIGAMPVVERGKLLGLCTVTDVLDAEVRAAMGSDATVATAGDVMSPLPYKVSPDMSLVEAVRLMVERHVRHLPVVDRTGMVVGMLSEIEVRTAVGDPLDYLRPRGRSDLQLRVEDAMSRSVVAVPMDRPLVTLARQFADARITAVPIIDAFGSLVGIVSYVDVLRGLAR